MRPGMPRLLPALAILSIVLPTTDAAMAAHASGVDAFRQAYLAWDAGQLDAAIDALTAAAEVAPTTFSGWYWLAVARLHRLMHGLREPGYDADAQELDALEQALEKAHALHPGHAEIEAMLGTLAGIRSAQGSLSALRYGRAFRSHFDRALQREPANPRVHYLYAQSLVNGPARLGGARLARRHFSIAAKAYARERSNPSDATPATFWGQGSTLAWLGRLRLAAGDRQGAEDAFRQALRIHPGHSMAREGLATLKRPEP